MLGSDGQPAPAQSSPEILKRGEGCNWPRALLSAGASRLEWAHEARQRRLESQGSEPELRPSFL